MSAQECSGIRLYEDCLPRKGAERTFVYKGEYLGQQVAVKRIPFEKHSLFLREASLLTNLAHKNIVELAAQPHIDVVNGEEFGCLVMPWYENDLNYFLNDSQPDDTYKVLEDLVLPISAALKYVHSRHKSHRDIKPSNILLNSKFEPVIADFGVGKDLSHLDNRTVGAHSSRGYTPELPGDPYQQDVFSFGVVMLELLIGQPTNTSINRDLELQNSNLPMPVVKLIRRCLEYSPENRYRTMVEVCDAIVDLLRLHKIQSEENSIYLSLTPSFKRTFQIFVQSSEHNLERKLLNLLSAEELHIRPTLNEEGEPPIDDFWIVAENFEIKVTGDPKTGVLRALKYVQFDYERKRRKRTSMPLPAIYWKIVSNNRANSKGPNKNDKRTYAEIRSKFDFWIAAGRPTVNLDQVSIEISELLDTWGRTLDATEKVLRGKGTGIKFIAQREQGTGKDFIFELEDFIEGDLAGSFWEIEELPGAVGEVQLHEGNEVALYFRRQPKRKLPTTGRLKPALDDGSRIALERKREALSSILENRGANPRLGVMLSRTFSEQPPRPLEQINWIKESLDESKKTAVQIALGSENVALVQGPPGTGKTEFIVELIGQILSRNSAASILLVSQTHVALDNALQRLQTGNVTDKIARLGNPESKSIAETSKKLLPSNQQSNWAQQLAEQSTRFSTNLALTAGLKAHEAVGVVNLMKIKDSFKQLEAIDRSIKETDPETQSESTKELRKKLKSQITKNQDLLKDQIEGVKTLTTSQGAQELIDAISAKVSGNLDFLEIIDTQTRWISKLLVSDQLESLFLKSRSVLAGTCLGFLSNPAARDLEFDYCILDEASRATPSEALVPFTKSRKVILVGDSNQLGTSYFELENQTQLLKEFGLSKSDLQESLFTFLEGSLPSSLISSLNIQYRMADPIGRLISNCFYGNSIISKGPLPVEGLNFVKFDGNSIKPFYKPVTWVDTSRIENGETPDRGSKYNESEVKEIVSSISSLSRMKSAGISKLPENLSILVISPYAAQVNRIKKSLERESIRNLNFEVLSVDAVQGREADLVFFSPVRSNSDPENIGFITRERINVALSRAKHSLVVVANADFWSEGTSKLSDVYRYIQTMSENDSEIKVLP